MTDDIFATKTYEEYAAKRREAQRVPVSRDEWQRRKDAPAPRKPEIIAVNCAAVPTNIPLEERGVKAEAKKPKMKKELAAIKSEVTGTEDEPAPEDEMIVKTALDADIEKIAGILKDLTDTQNRIVDDMLKDRERIETLEGIIKLNEATLQSFGEDLDNFEKRIDALESFCGGLRFERGAEVSKEENLG